MRLNWELSTTNKFSVNYAKPLKKSLNINDQNNNTDEISSAQKVDFINEIPGDIS